MRVLHVILPQALAKHHLIPLPTLQSDPFQPLYSLSLVPHSPYQHPFPSHCTWHLVAQPYLIWAQHATDQHFCRVQPRLDAVTWRPGTRASIFKEGQRCFSLTRDVSKVFFYGFHLKIEKYFIIQSIKSILLSQREICLGLTVLQMHLTKFMSDINIDGRRKKKRSAQCILCPQKNAVLW